MATVQAKKRGEITEEEHWQHLFNHMLGIQHWHEHDVYPPGLSSKLEAADLFAAAVKYRALQPDSIKGCTSK